jgi:FixJ family two-component response regulator
MGVESIYHGPFNCMRTILIVVDNDAGFLQGVARLLAHSGIESRTFASAEALLESGSAQMLAVRCSTSTSAEFRGSSCSADLRHQGRPVVFMTGDDDEARRNEAADAGCTAYLRKPFARNVLLDAIGKAVAYPNSPALRNPL